MGELESNVDVVRRMLDAFNAGNDAAMLGLAHPGIVFVPLVGRREGAEVQRGKEAVARYTRELRESWQQLRLTADQVRAIEDAVIVFGMLEGRGRSDELHTPITSVWRVRDGLLAEGVLVSRDTDTEAAHPRRAAPFLVEVPAVASSVGEVRDAVSEWAEELGASPDEVGALRLCVSEAVTNSILHGYVDRPPGLVRVSAVAEGAEMVVSVEDEGCGMRPHPESPGLGMGLPLMGQMAGSLNIVSVPERMRGCCLRMTFRVAALAEAAVGTRSAVAAAG